MKYYLAIDLGASSGRHIVGWQENGEIQLKEVHRFPNGMIPSENGLLWDTEALFNNIKIGIKKALEEFKEIESLSIDTWGVDYVLMNGEQILYPHFAYRNERNEKASELVHQIVPFSELYEHTGMQFAAFNTIYQLFDDLKAGRLEKATDFLMIPQYFSYLLTGVKSIEYTDASTSGLLNVKTNDFDQEIIAKLGLKKEIFKEIKQPGTVLGYLKDDIAKEVGGNMKVVLCASHDTGSAFEAVDCPEDAVFLSSGTWSLIGVKIPHANSSINSYNSNFTNEGGVGYIRYLKNIMGMWIPNQVQKITGMSFEQIFDHIDDVKYNEVFDVNDKSLAAPDNMKEAVINLLKHNPPKNDQELFVSIYRSLANSYKAAFEQIEKNLGKTFNSLYIVGGGAKNKYINRITEELLGKKVVALPIEATAIGNLKIQMKAGQN